MQDVINIVNMRRKSSLDGAWRIPLWLLLFALFLPVPLQGQEHLRLMTYNVENLFDCADDSITHDEAFLPTSLRRWTAARYWHKLQAVSRAIAAVGGDRAPDFVALCEVENDSVMHDLTRRSSLRVARYNYLMTSSADPRGIDVALMYKPTTFRPLHHRALRLPQSEMPPGSYVRDVLYVSGQLHMGDTLDLFVCHLPSRLNGRKSLRLRRTVVEYVRQAIDSVCQVRKVPRIVVMGDFNDTPDSESLRPFSDNSGLVCITDNLGGSYRYKGKWEQIDHVYLSPSLVGGAGDGLRLSPRGAWIADDDLLTEPEPLYGGRRPYRTYNGVRYMGGTSDHLPVCFDLWFRW